MRVLICLAFAVVSVLRAQTAPFTSFQPILQSTIASDVAADVSSGSDAYSASTSLLIQNRARTLGPNRLDGSGTRYFSVTDADLHGLSPSQVLQRLNPPPVSAGSGVQREEISVNLEVPLVVRPKPGQSINIGAADVQAENTRDVEVHASIFMDGLIELPD